MHHHNILIVKLFILTLDKWTSNFASINIFGLESTKLLKPQLLKDNLAYTTFQVNLNTSKNNHPLLIKSISNNIDIINSIKN